MVEVVRRCRPLLGTFVEVTAEHDDLAEIAFAAIEQIHQLMSAQDLASDVSRINRFGHSRAVEVHPLTAQVIERAIFWSRESGGAFDIVKAGGLALENGYLPRHPGQPAARADRWTELDLAGRAVQLARPGCIDLGGIAKGFAVDQAVAAMRAAGASTRLVNAGGDIAGFGSEPWPVTVAAPLTRAPLAEIELCDAALATSAVLPDGSSTHLPRRHSVYVSASVIAPSCADADALAKILLSQSRTADHCLALAGATGFVSTVDGVLGSERLAA